MQNINILKIMDCEEQMPWTPDSVDEHKKGLNDVQKKKWVRVANGVLKSCVAENGKKCEERAIRIANSMFEKGTKRRML